MRALIVYESTFGNTESVARAIATGLADHGVGIVVRDVALHPSAYAGDYDIVVGGGPARGFRPARGLSAWIDSLLPLHTSVCAVFETRAAHRPMLPTATAYAATRALRRVGGPSVARPRAFLLDDDLGPVAEGELERARAWGGTLALLAGCTAAVEGPRMPEQNRADLRPASAAGERSAAMPHA